MPGPFQQINNMLTNISSRSTSFNSALNGRGSCINFIVFEKAFDSIHRDSLWCILRVRAYGIPLHIVQIIKSFYHNFTCSIGSSSLNFQVGTGVRQGCVMPEVLFNLVMDWVSDAQQKKAKMDQMDTL